MKIYGIRHHGPGSAKALRIALEAQQPDCVLIEGPADADDLIPYVGDADLKTPVALLVYNPKDLRQAIYAPFADFSPEWQAMQYAVTNNIPVSFMDLPQSLSFSLDADAKKELQLALPEGIDENDPLYVRDPLGYMAGLAGYSDSERWWEITFEQSDPGSGVFDVIFDMMCALRESPGKVENPENLLREAYMRQTIRKALKAGHKNLAIVCGAWHSPALADLARYKESTDAKLLKGLKKTATVATWIPWSYDRLSMQSGYQAGIISPAWYEMLFHHRKNASVYWMSRVARLLRKEDLSASSAHAIEAVRLAETLAALRGRAIPGMDELEESVLSLFCAGDPAPMELIRKQLIIGDVIGQVPESIPVVPLQRDFEACVKTARLSKEYQSAFLAEKNLDLRKESNLVASQLLHRLQLLGIPWGKPVEISAGVKSSFHENWTLHWKPDFAILLIEASMWGATVEEAAAARTLRQVAESDRLPQATTLLETALKADLKNAIPDIIRRIEELSALTRDVLLLMETLPSLVSVLRYGSARKLDAGAVAQIVRELIPRICVGLPGACAGMDEDASRAIFKQLLAANHALGLLNDPGYFLQWHHTLRSLSSLPQVNGIISGACTRILFDKGLFDKKQASGLMHYALSKGNTATESAQWLEGFLHGSGLLLIHQPSLWEILDGWVASLSEESFTDILPLLRRTFAQFPPPERQQMMAISQKPTQAAALNQPVQDDLDPARAEPVWKALKEIIG